MFWFDDDFGGGGHRLLLLTHLRQHYVELHSEVAAAHVFVLRGFGNLENARCDDAFVYLISWPVLRIETRDLKPDCDWTCKISYFRAASMCVCVFATLHIAVCLLMPWPPDLFSIACMVGFLRCPDSVMT